MSLPINISSATTQMLLVSSATTGSYNFTTSTNANSAVTNAYTNADSTTSARLQLSASRSSTRTSTVYFEFDKTPLSEIPSNATISSVSARVKYYVSSMSYVTAVSIQLHNNTSAKGSATTARTTTATVYTMTAGTWTATELQNIRLYVSATHSASNSAAYLYLYGVDVTVNYSVNDTAYEVNVTNNSIATVSPTYASGMTGENITITFGGIQDKAEIVVLDNNVDVTNSLVANGGTGYQYTISNISADHTVVVSDNPSLVKHTVNASSSYAGATVSPATQQVIEGRNATVEFEVDHLYEIIVKDNGTVVTPTEAVPSTNVSFIPSEFVQSASTFSATGTTYPPSNGLANSASTNYATFSAQTVANAIVEAVYKFNCSSIPVNAVIDSVTCGVRAGVSSTTYLTTRYAQLYCGDSAKGNQSSSLAQVSYTAPTAISFNGGSWTRDELDNINIRIIAQRGTSTNAASIRFYGASLTITYHVPCSYTITNVQTNHTITVEEAPYFNVTTANTYAGATVTASPYKVYSGQSTTITVAVANLYEVVIKDNNVDVTSQFTGSNGTYTRTLSNVNANHVITIEEAPYYTVSTSSTYSSASVSVSPAKIYSGRNANITVSVPNLYEVRIKLDGTDITNNFTGSNGTYSYTLQNVTANHTLTIEEAPKYLLTASSKYAGVSISPSSVYVYEGQGITFTLSGTVAKIVLKDNGTDVTSSMVQSGSNYLYTISNVSQVHTIEVRVNTDYVKVSGTYKEIKKFFKKVNGDWQEITKTQFDTQLSEQVFMYGGHFTGATVVGEVVKSQNAIEIVLNDNALEPGTYKFVYEDAGKEPLDNVDEITQFTIS